MTQDIHTVENMTARSAFIRLVTTRPDPDSTAHALVRGPLSTYGTFAATIYGPDDLGQSLDLIGQWGFGPALGSYARVPLDLDFPLVRTFLTGEAIVTPARESMRSVLAQTATGAVLADLGRGLDEVTVVAMPLQYQGVAIGASVWFCTHQGPWTWNDYSYIDGTAAILSLWLQLRTYEHSLHAAGVGGGRFSARPHLLTERQRTVLLMIRDGKSNAAIAAALGYSVSTVKNDVQALFTVLGASKRKELVRKATDAGLLTEDSAAAP